MATPQQGSSAAPAAGASSSAPAVPAAGAVAAGAVPATDAAEAPKEEGSTDAPSDGAAAKNGKEKVRKAGSSGAVGGMLDKALSVGAGDTPGTGAMGAKAKPGAGAMGAKAKAGAGKAAGAMGAKAGGGSSSEDAGDSGGRAKRVSALSSKPSAEGQKDGMLRTGVKAGAGAVKGAAKGAKRGEPVSGALIGAAAGAAQGVLRSSNGKKKLLVLAFIMCPAAFLVPMLVIMMLASLLGGSSVVTDTAASQAYVAAGKSGVDPKMSPVYTEAAANSNVPWTVVAAVGATQAVSGTGGAAPAGPVAAALAAPGAAPVVAPPAPAAPGAPAAPVAAPGVPAAPGAPAAAPGAPAPGAPVPAAPGAAVPAAPAPVPAAPVGAPPAPGAPAVAPAAFTYKLAPAPATPAPPAPAPPAAPASGAAAPAPAGEEPYISMSKAFLAKFPQGVITAAKNDHANDGGHHPRGEAIDMANSGPGGLQAVADWVFSTYPDSAQEIYSNGPFQYHEQGNPYAKGSINVDNARQDYLRNSVYASEWMTHADHVHWARLTPVGVPQSSGATAITAPGAAGTSGNSGDYLGPLKIDVKAIAAAGGKPSDYNSLPWSADLVAKALLKALKEDPNYNPNDRLDIGSVVSQYGGQQMSTDPGLMAAQARTRQVYIGALKKLPVQNAEQNAESEYAMALAWDLGKEMKPISPTCGVSSSAGVGSGSGAGVGNLKIDGIPAAYVPLIQKAATPDIPAAVLAAQLEAESNFTDPTSSTGAQGPAQFEPYTWPSWGRDTTGKGYADVHNPSDAVDAQGRFDAALAQQVRDAQAAGKIHSTASVTEMALGGYNAGIGAVLSAGGIPQNQQTQQYVPKIMNLARTKYSTAGTITVPPAVNAAAAAPAPAAPAVTDVGCGGAAPGGAPGGTAGGGAMGTGGGPKAQKVIAAAHTELGLPYIWGGGGYNGPTGGGFDCSGLTSYAFHQVGLDLPRTAQDQYSATASSKLPGGFDPASYQPGDLIFYGTADNIHHVAIAIGNGQLIQASTFGEPLNIKAIYHSDFFAATRPLGSG